MQTATADSIQTSNRDIEAVKAELRQRFEAHLSHASDAALLRLARLKDEKAFAALAKTDADEKRSANIKSQASRARMLAKAFDRVNERCELLEASEVAEILGISKQALSQKTKAGQILAYTNQRRKYYPAFQLADNKVRPAITALMRALEVDASDVSGVNFFIQHLISKMDFSDADEPSNVVPRFELLDNSAAIEIIKRDYVNAFEMGQ